MNFNIICGLLHNRKLDEEGDNMKWVRTTKSEFLTKEEYIRKTSGGNWLYQRYYYNEDDIEVGFYEEIILLDEVEKLLNENNWEVVE